MYSLASNNNNNNNNNNALAMFNLSLTDNCDVYDVTIRSVCLRSNLVCNPTYDLIVVVTTFIIYWYSELGSVCGAVVSQVYPLKGWGRVAGSCTCQDNSWLDIWSFW